MAATDKLDPDKIRLNLQTERIGTKVVVHDRTSSTSNIAAEYARNPANDGLVVFAEEQAAGRGRTGATWHSRYGDSLLFSVVLIGCELANELLSLTVAVAVAEAIGPIGGRHVRIKWPNDILLEGRKLGGILLESRRNGASLAHIIGIGINCHQSEETFPPEIRNLATSIDAAGSVRCDRITLARRVLTSLDHWLAIAQGDGHRIIDTWKRQSTQLGHRVTVSCDGKEYTGNCIGVDPIKGLILHLDRGGVRMFNAAHTRIVK
jgi:BirA family transcriptional regulator, biotin operon repressor / biotin---[acetyl-CoA-carboxylase] ligase